MNQDYVLDIVRQNKYNFYFEVIIKLFYSHFIYISELIIAIFPFFVFSPKILAEWPPFWSFYIWDLI